MFSSSHPIRIGGTTPTELRALLEEAQVMLNPMAEQLFADPRFTVRQESSLVEVVTGPAAGLGFQDGATFEQLVAQASRYGLTLCPLELAPHFRLQFTEQAEASTSEPPARHQAPPGSVTVASAPPTDEQDIPWGFYLRRIEGRLWLRGYRSWSGHVWAPRDEFAFIRAHNAD